MRRGVSVAGLPAIAVIWMVFLMPDCASACSCGVPAGSSPRELVRQELSSSDAVFAGEVVDIDKPLPLTSSVDPVTVAFRDRKEHTSELQSRQYLVCRLLLEQKKNTRT